MILLLMLLSDLVFYECEKTPVFIVLIVTAYDFDFVVH